MAPIALSADIAKMYRQVALNETDCDFHRILWRSDASKPIEHYRLVRVTYGIALSAFHSIRTLHAIADSAPCSLASTVLKRDFYVDELLSGAKTVTEALALQQSLIDMLKHGGFDLRKWSSIDRSVLAHMCARLRTLTLTKHTHSKFGHNLEPVRRFLFVLVFFTTYTTANKTFAAL